MITITGLGKGRKKNTINHNRNSQIIKMKIIHVQINFRTRNSRNSGGEKNQRRGQKDENEMYQTSGKSALQFNQTREGSIFSLYL